MKAIVFDRPGDESVMELRETGAPKAAHTEVKIRVHATSVNRADLLQRRGHYPPPKGASEILGLECAGVIEECGEAVAQWKKGDRVMALLAGGGYAEEAVAHAGSVMRIPEALRFEEAGAMPEVFLTAFLNIFKLGRVARGETVLIHGGGSGVGTAATTLCKLRGMRVLVTAGSDEKCARCRQHGADVAINYKKDDFAEVVRRETDGGVDVILDAIGGSYLERNVGSLAQTGRLILIGAMGGRTGTLDVGSLLSRRLQVIGSTLRSRTVEEKAGIVHAFLSEFGDDLEAGRIRPVIDRVLPLASAGEAHRALAQSEHFGKVVLRVG